MDKLDLKIGTSKTNLLLTITKMIVKANLKTTSDIKRAGLVEISDDLKHCLETIKTLEKEYNTARQRAFDLELICLMAKNEVKEQIKRNEELIKLI
jgi:hypothetical protein